MGFGIIHIIIWLLPFVIFGFSKKKTWENLLLYFLIINVGVQGVLCGLVQMFQGQAVAHHLEWSWSPFVTLLGMANFSFGVLGLLCYWRRTGDFWMATALGYGLFLFLAFIGHLYHFVGEHSLHGHGSFMLYTDLLTPVSLFILFRLYRKKKKSWFQ